MSFRLNDYLLKRKWQEEALEEWERESKGVVEVVTGGGKTIFAMFCMESLLEDRKNCQVVIIVPTIALLDQWYLELIEHTSLSENDIALYGGGGREVRSAKVSIAVINTARSVAEEICASQETLLIVDECHRSGTQENVRSIAVESDYTLGLSATPEREFDDGFDRYIEPNLGAIVYRYSFAQALADKVISEFDLINVNVGVRGSIGEGHFRETSNVDGFDKKLLEAIKVRAVVSLIRRKPLESTIVFNERISVLENMCRAIDQAGMTSLAYHSGLGPSLRRFNLEMFRRGQTKRLITCRALDEGLNVPGVSVGIIAFSTRSLRQRVQRLGRVLRAAPGKSKAVVYTLYSSEEERLRLEEESESLEGLAGIQWLSVGVQDV